MFQDIDWNGIDYQEMDTETNEKSIFQDTDWNKINFFEDFGWQQQNLKNNLTEQSDQMRSSAYLSTGPAYTGDPAQYDECVFDVPQPGAADGVLNSVFMSELPTAPQAGPTYTGGPSSPPTCLNITTSSQLAPPWSVFPTEQTSSSPLIRQNISTANNQLVLVRGKPKKHIEGCTYTYESLDTAPASWDIFEYNSFGELEPGRTYSPQELKQYLYRNPQHQVDGTYNPMLGGFTLWIQRTPRDSSFRYGYLKENLCRFENCEHDNVLKAGDIRVAFDELTKNHPNFDPMHSTGYVHLGCLEKHLNFPMLCKDLDVRPEGRVFPPGFDQKNPMILQDRTELDHVQRFIDFSIEHGRPPKCYDERTLNAELLHFGPTKLRGIALYLWQRWGVRWDDGDKAKKQLAKDRSRAKKDDARAQEKAAKKRARKEGYPQKKRPHAITKSLPKKLKIIANSLPNQVEFVHWDPSMIEVPMIQT